MNEVFTYDITYLNIGLGEALIHSYQKQAPLKRGLGKRMCSMHVRFLLITI